MESDRVGGSMTQDTENSCHHPCLLHYHLSPWFVFWEEPGNKVTNAENAAPSRDCENLGKVLLQGLRLVGSDSPPPRSPLRFPLLMYSCPHMNSPLNSFCPQVELFSLPMAAHTSPLLCYCTPGGRTHIRFIFVASLRLAHGEPTIVAFLEWIDNWHHWNCPFSSSVRIVDPES